MLCSAKYMYILLYWQSHNGIINFIKFLWFLRQKDSIFRPFPLIVKWTSGLWNYIICLMRVRVWKLSILSNNANFWYIGMPVYWDIRIIWIITLYKTCKGLYRHCTYTAQLEKTNVRGVPHIERFLLGYWSVLYKATV